MTWAMEHVREAPGVSADDIFGYYADPETWGRWAHNTGWARARTTVDPGAIVDVGVRRYPWTYGVVVREVEPGRRIVTEVRPIGVRIVSTYEVTPIEGGARLRHEMTCSGPLERGYRLLRAQYTRLLARETRDLAALVAAEAGGRR
jgi:hypothetical protein